MARPRLLDLVPIKTSLFVTCDYCTWHVFFVKTYGFEVIYLNSLNKRSGPRSRLYLIAIKRLLTFEIHSCCNRLIKSDFLYLNLYPD